MTNAITVVDSASTSTTGAGNQTIITGTPSAGSFASFQIPYSQNIGGGVAIVISGTWTGTLAFEQSPDGVNYAPIDAMQEGVDAAVSSTIANGLFKIAAAADYQVRVRATAAITGTANIAFTASTQTDLQHVVIVDSGNVDNGALLTFTAAAAGTYNSADQVNCSGIGLNCILNITVATSTSVTVTIQGKDVASGVYYTILASAAKNSTGTTVLSVFPGLSASANVSANAILPRIWRVSAVVTGASSALTGTVGASVV